MYEINNLAKKTLNKQLLTEFLDFVNEQLKIKEPYSVYFVEDKTNAKDPLGRTAMYNPSSSSVYIYATNRHPKDLLRSIAHELMHHKQKEQGKLGKMHGEGSVTEEQLELEANEAGYLVRMFEDGRKQLKEQAISKQVAGALTDTFGDATAPDWIIDYYTRFMKYITSPTKMASLVNAPRQVGVKGSRFPTYKKCLPHQEKRGAFLCYPKGFSKNKRFSNFADLNLKDLKAVLEDLKETKKANRRTIFENQERTLFAATVILPKILATVKNVKNAPIPPEGYAKKREEYLKKFEKAFKDKIMTQDQLGGQLGQFIRKDTEDSVELPDKLTNEQTAKEKFVLYPTSVIDDARRVYLIFKDGEYRFPDGDRPFRASFELSQEFQNEIKALLGGEKRIRQIEQIYAVNARASDAVMKSEDFFDIVHGSLDILGLSPDTAGVGLTADFVNGLLYLGRGKWFDAAMSLAAVGFFGDIIKVERGLWRRAAQLMQDWRTNIKYFIEDKFIGTFITWSEYAIKRFDQYIAKYLEKYAQTAPDKIPSWASAVFDRLSNQLGNIKKSLKGWQDTIEAFKKYNEELRKLNKSISKGISPKDVQRILKQTENQEHLLAVAIQRRANSLEKTSPQVMAGSKVKGMEQIGANRKTAISNLEAKKADIQEFIDDLPPGSDDIISRKRKEISSLNQKMDKFNDLPNYSNAALEQAKELMKNNPRLADAMVAEIRAAADYVAIPKQLKERLLNQLKNANNVDDIPKIGEKFIKENLDKFMLEALEETAANSPKVKEIIELNVRKLFGKGAPRAARAGLATTRAVVRPIVRFLTKNILGTEGLFGVIYSSLLGNLLKSWRSTFKSAKLSSILGGLFLKLPFNVGISVLLSGPITIVGKLSFLNTYYVRYYRNFCGGADQFKPLAAKLVKKIINGWWSFVTSPIDSAEKAYEEIKKYIKEGKDSKNEKSIIDSFIKQFKCKRKVVMQDLLKQVGDVDLMNAFIQYDQLLQSYTMSGFAQIYKQYYEPVLSELDKLANMESKTSASDALAAGRNIVTNATTTAKAAQDNPSVPLPRSVTAARDEVVKQLKAAQKKGTPKQREAAKKARRQFEGTEGQYEESKNKESLSDYREKLLEERLEKLTIGLIK